MTTKICKECRQPKVLSEFHLSKSNRLGVNDTCKSCRSIQQATAYKAHWFEKQVILKRSWCKAKQIPFDLDAAHLEGLWTEECPIYRVPFVLHDKKHPMSPTLDRLDPRLGYVKGNVVYISSRANRIKYDATAEELFKIGMWLEGATTRSKDRTLKRVETGSTLTCEEIV